MLFIQESIIFNQWKNKKYSVFQSLKKVIQIGFLPLVYILIFNFPALAQTDTIKIEEIIINSTRVPALYPEIARIVKVVEKSEIENVPVQSIAELLELVANVDVRQRGVYGVQADISMRGGSFDQTLILINGIKINDPQTGHHSLNLPIDIENIQRIEILEGPGARIYGQNAFSGAINIITNENYDNNITASITAGQYNLFGGTISSAFNLGKLSSYISVSKKVCNGYISNTDFDISNLFYQGNLETKLADFSVQAGITNKSFGANSFHTPKYPNQYEITQTSFASLKAEIGHKFKVIPAIYWRRNQDVFELFRESENWYQHQGNFYIKDLDTAKYYPNNYQAWNYYSGHNFHLTNIIGAEINSNFRTKIGKTSFGIEYRSEDILSNKLGEDVDSVKVSFLENQFFTKQHTRENFSVYVDHFAKISKFSFSTGVLVNWNSDFNWNYYTGFDVSYSFTDNLKAISSVNQSMRMPTFTDLYYQSATNIGNPDLKPETAITYEFGIKYLTKKISANIVAFKRNGKDIIDWVKLINTDKWTSMNYTEMNTFGVEFSANLNFSEIVGTNFFIRNVNFSYSYLNSDKNSNDYISNYALDYLINSASLSIYQDIYKKFGASWSYSYQDRNGTFSKYIPETGSTEEAEFKPVNLLSGKIYYRAEYFEIYTEATNILNKKYYDLGNILMPGIWVRVGVKVKFSF